jgi:hypothetical protein
MELSVERMATIIACMYGVNAEVVVDLWNLEDSFEEEDCTCYLFTGWRNNRLRICYKEVRCLICNEIIELDSGNDEPGQESKVYRLTENAQERIQEIIENKRKMQLLLK